MNKNLVIAGSIAGVGVIALVLILTTGGDDNTDTAPLPPIQAPVTQANTAAATSEPSPAADAGTSHRPDTRTATSGNNSESADSNTNANTQAVPDRPGSEARALIAAIRAGEIEMDAVHLSNRAHMFSAAGKHVDAHLMNFFLAHEGHVPAMMELAEGNDPLHFGEQPRIMDEPDAGQAFKWYDKAIKANNDTARERMKALRQWAENAAKKGDPYARQLLLRWH